MLPQHQPAVRHTDGLWHHDLVSQGVLQHAILVDTRLVRKRIAAYDCLIGLNRNAGDLSQQLARRKQLLGCNARRIGITLRPNSDGHHDFFQGSVAGPLADPVDRALDLACACGHSGHGIGHGQSEIVMAVG